MKPAAKISRSAQRMSRPARVWAIAALLALTFAAAACDAQTAANPTLDAKVAEFAATATYRASGQDDTRVTAQAVEVNATATRQAAAATQVVKSTAVDVAAQATATAIAPMVAELPFYDVDPALGSMGWIHPPVSITVDAYHDIGYANEFPTVIARDFVIAGDVTWNSTYESSGCGFVLRSSGDADFPDQYIVAATGLGYGHIFFAALAHGELANIKDFYLSEVDPAFEWRSGSVNRLAVVGDGTILRIYSNFNLVGEVDTSLPPDPVPHLPPKPQRPGDTGNAALIAKYNDDLRKWEESVTTIEERYAEIVAEYENSVSLFEEGFVALIAANESGDTQCVFNDTWLWLIEE